MRIDTSIFMEKREFDNYITLFIFGFIFLFLIAGNIATVSEENVQDIEYDELPPENPEYPEFTLEYSAVYNGNDTDEDGFTDSYERNDTLLNPDTKDVIVYTVYTDEARISDSDLNEITNFYKTSPVDNNSGINIHFIEIDHNFTQKVTYKTTNEHFFSSVSRKNRSSAHIMYVTENIEMYSDSNVLGFAHNQYNFFAVQTGRNDERVTIAHELGHSLGLLPMKNTAIDSTAVRYEDYPSIMNYNYGGSGEEELVFADNEHYDDWEMIEEHMENKDRILFG